MASGVAAVIAAAGSGKRIGASVPKQWLSLGGIPLIVHALHFFDNLEAIDQIAMALDRETLDDPARLAHLRSDNDKPLRLVEGGAQRQESVLAALKSLEPQPEIVLIHDAARAFPPQASVLEAIEVARQAGGAVLARPVTDTIKRVDASGRVVETLDRSTLWAAQTPQVFRFEDLAQAYRAAGPHLGAYTDDAGIFEAAGGAVVVVQSAGPNFKITHPEDFERAEKWLAQRGHL